MIMQRDHYVLFCMIIYFLLNYFKEDIFMARKMKTMDGNNAAVILTQLKIKNKQTGFSLHIFE